MQLLKLEEKTKKRSAKKNLEETAYVSDLITVWEWCERLKKTGIPSSLVPFEPRKTCQRPQTLNAPPGRVRHLHKPDLMCICNQRPFAAFNFLTLATFSLPIGFREYSVLGREPAGAAPDRQFLG